MCSTCCLRGRLYDPSHRSSKRCWEDVKKMVSVWCPEDVFMMSRRCSDVWIMPSRSHGFEEVTNIFSFFKIIWKIYFLWFLKKYFSYQLKPKPQRYKTFFFSFQNEMLIIDKQIVHSKKLMSLFYLYTFFFKIDQYHTHPLHSKLNISKMESWCLAQHFSFKRIMKRAIFFLFFFLNYLKIMKCKTNKQTKNKYKFQFRKIAWDG